MVRTIWLVQEFSLSYHETTLTSVVPSPMGSQFLEDASYLRLKTLRLSWTLPETWMRKTRFIRNLTIYAQGENLYTWTGYRGADPEVNGGYDIMAYPKPRTITFGLDMNF